ncbi:MAG: hypothetical protein ACKOPU_05610 [Candidatus Planktophila sp.]
MIQWVGVLIAILGLAYNGVKDYQKGEIKIPALPQKQVLTKPNYPVQYCLMAYDPNVDKVFYLHENGQWHDYAPQQRRYEATPQRGQTQGQATVGSSYGSQGTQGYGYGQSAQAVTNKARY